MGGLFDLFGLFHLLQAAPSDRSGSRAEGKTGRISVASALSSQIEKGKAQKVQCMPAAIEADGREA